MPAAADRPEKVKRSKALAYTDHIHYHHNRYQQPNLRGRTHAHLFNLETIGFEVLEEAFGKPADAVTVSNLAVAPGGVANE